MSAPATVRHPWFARVYRMIAAGAERAGAADHRHDALSGLRGKIIEIGAGSGMNFSHYPPEVTEVLAVEPEPYLRRHATVAARSSPVPVTVVEGTAERLPAGDGTFDAAVFSLVLCSVTDQRAALEEAGRVLRTGGQLRVYEHVRADTARLGHFQDAITPFWRHVGGGCHPNRETAATVRDAGFEVEEERRFTFRPSVVALPVSPHLILRARRVPRP